MKLVVTGAAGFIGSHTCAELVSRGHEVVGVDSFDDFLYPASVKRANAEALVHAVDPGRFRLSEVDITQGEAINRIIVESGADAVCHLAALAGVRPSLRDPARYIRTNLEGTIYILEACRAAGIERVVFASSSSVYGARAAYEDELSKVEPFREDAPCLTPASPYAASKRAGELLCSSYRDLYGLGISSLRFFTVYGPRQRPDMAIHRFFRAIHDGTSITMYGDGSSRRDYTFIEDIVAGTVAACERVEPGAYRIYNLGGTQTTSLADLIEQIQQTMGKRAEIRRAPNQPGDVPITYADITNSKADLDYAPTTPLSVGLSRFWEWFQAHES